MTRRKKSKKEGREEGNVGIPVPPTHFTAHCAKIDKIKYQTICSTLCMS